MTNTAFPPRRKRGLILTAFVAGLIVAGTVAPHDGGASNEGGVNNATAAPAGAPAGAAVQQTDPADKGKWTGVYPNWEAPTAFEIPGVPVHLNVLPNGKLFYWGRDKDKDATGGYDVGDQCNTYLWDPLYPRNNDETTKIANTTTNLFCSGHSFLPDGKLFVAGGHVRSSTNNGKDEGIGEVDLNVFDYKKNEWTLLDTRMPRGRWYPFNLTLDDGRTMIVAGSHLTSNGKKLNQTPDILNLDGTLAPPGAVPTDTHTGEGDWFTNYPFIHLAPGGEPFYAAALNAEARSRYLDKAMNTWVRIPPLCPSASRPDLAPSLMNPHSEGTSVMYAPGKVMVVGGMGYGRTTACDNIVHNNLPGKTNEVIDLSNLSAPTKPQWVKMDGEMNFGRRFFTSALLPDGKVFVVGGTQCEGGNVVSSSLCTDGAVTTPEIWNPENDEWTKMAPHQEVRVYHSTAALLPDARVFVGGGGLPAASGETASYKDSNNQTVSVKCEGVAAITEFPCSHHAHRKVEIFSPPYLYEKDGNGVTVPARRPAITSAPASVGFGEQFRVGVGDLGSLSTDVGGVVLIRLPSVTHGFNQDQRRVPLTYSVDPNDNKKLVVTAPADGRDCPPGPYMLFVLRNGQNSKKVPSVAKIIRVGHFSITKDSGSVLPGGGTVRFDVKAPAGVIWHATAAGASWVSLSTTSSSTCSAPAGSVCGTGNSTVTVTVSANTAPSPSPPPGRREAKITLSIPDQKYTGHDFTVYQAGAIFNDAEADSESIYKLYARGITGGCRPGEFCPDELVTRGQMALFIAKAMGIHDPPAPPASDSSFSDVTPDGPMGFMYRYVELLARLGITSGCGGGRFCPGDPVKREQMAAFLIKARAMRNPIPRSEGATFADVPRTHLFFNWIEELSRQGITSGCQVTPDRLFCPGDTVTRREMALFLVRTFDL